ncbi:Hypothetical_protein [Hexamita inflata]|uniref:Hypothetical_protein n=1 Tax=Hexamita inflata TaxID=28002 RepID=A0AA86PDY0_9EUKA|nr:Hypothetical protein HINF_LOCUS21637 [Hexamita inflata]
MYIYYVLAVECGDTHVTYSQNLNSSTWFKQQCQDPSSECVSFDYVDLPESYKSVFQLVDPDATSKYNLCGQYTTQRICLKYCSQQCLQVSSTIQGMKFDLAMSARHNKTIVTQDYVNETAYANYQYICSSAGTQNYRLLLVILVPSISLLVLIILTVYINVKCKKQQKNMLLVENMVLVNCVSV